MFQLLLCIWQIQPVQGNWKCNSVCARDSVNNWQKTSKGLFSKHTLYRLEKQIVQLARQTSSRQCKERGGTPSCSGDLKWDRHTRTHTHTEYQYYYDRYSTNLSANLISCGHISVSNHLILFNIPNFVVLSLPVILHLRPLLVAFIFLIL